MLLDASVYYYLISVFFSPPPWDEISFVFLSAQIIYAQLFIFPLSSGLSLLDQLICSTILLILDHCHHHHQECCIVFLPERT